LPLFLLGHSFGPMAVSTLVPMTMKLLFTPHGHGMISTKHTTSANLKWVCSNPEVVKERLHDPYRKNLKYQLHHFDALHRLHDWSSFHPTKSNLPILSSTGKDGPIPRGARGLSDTERSLKRIGYHRISCVVFEGMRHDVVFNQIKEFLLAGTEHT